MHDPGFSRKLWLAVLFAAILQLAACSSGNGEDDAIQDQAARTVDAAADATQTRGQDVNVPPDIDPAKPDVSDVGHDGQGPPADSVAGPASGKVSMVSLAPGNCGCPEPVQEGYQTECGWMLGHTATIPIQAEFVPDPGSPPLLIAEVQLIYTDIDTSTMTILDSQTQPAPSGLYELSFKAAALPIDLAPFSMQVDPIYLTAKAITEKPAPDTKPFVRMEVLAFDLDLIPPNVKVLEPIPDDDITIPYVGKLPFSFQVFDVGSGLKRLKFVLDGQVLYDADVSKFDIEGDILSGEVDLSLAGNSDSGLVVYGIDCVGNQGEALVEALIVAKPQYTSPTRIHCADTEEHEPELVRIRLGQADADGLHPDFAAIHSKAVLASFGSAPGEFSDLVTIVPALKQVVDAHFVEVTGDGHPDLIVLHSSAGLGDFGISLYRQLVDDFGFGLRQFELADEWLVGDKPSAAEVADLDGDGLPDILVAHLSESESIGILTHSGKSDEADDGTEAFYLPVQFLTGVGSTKYFALGDVDNNGLVDIITARGTLGIVSTYLNLEDGLFPMAHDTLLLGSDVPLIQPGDFTNDGKLDVVAYTRDVRGAYEMHGLADGYFDPVSLSGLTWEEFGLEFVFPMLGAWVTDYKVGKAGKIMSVGNSVNSSAAADFNVDGNLDIVFADGDKGLLQLFYGLGDGSFAEAYFLNAGGDFPRSVVSGHLNDDVVPDMATAGEAPCQITLFMSQDVGSFGQPGGDAPILTTQAPATEPMAGIPRWSTSAEIPMPLQPKCWKQGRSAPQRIVARDFDGDGLVDIVIPMPKMPQSVCFAENGKIVTDNVRRPVVSLNDISKPEMFMTMLKSPGPTGFTAAIAVLAPGEFNGNDHLDLLIGDHRMVPVNSNSGNFATLTGGVKVEISNCDMYPGENKACCIIDDWWAAGHFGDGYGPAVSSPLLTAGTAALLDGDAIHDIVLTARANSTPGTSSYLPDSVQVLLARPSEAGLDFELAGQLHAPKTGEYPIAVETGYLDDDDTRDIVVANKDSNDLTLIRGVSGPTEYIMDHPSKPVKLLSVGSKPADVAVGDVDGDGWADIACVLKNKVSVSWGIDGENFAVPLYVDSLPSGKTFKPSLVLVEDVNMDGRDDLAILSHASDELYFYVSLGDKHLIGPFIFPTAHGPVDMVVADINKDGCRDLLVANEGAQTVTLLINEYCGILEQED